MPSTAVYLIGESRRVLAGSGEPNAFELRDLSATCGLADYIYLADLGKVTCLKHIFRGIAIFSCGLLSKALSNPCAPVT